MPTSARVLIVMEFSLQAKDLVSLVGLVGSLVAFAWQMRGTAAKVTIALNKVQSTVESIDQRLTREERKSSRAHVRIDEMAEKLTRLDVLVAQIRGEA